jgi:hypothetical protein
VEAKCVFEKHGDARTPRIEEPENDATRGPETQKERDGYNTMIAMDPVLLKTEYAIFLQMLGPERY